MKKLGLYIHIPFCVKKCDYCDFISYCDKTEYIEKYIESLKNEINNNVGALSVINTKGEYQTTPLENSNYQITTVYIGGGTPSSIDSKYIVDIMDTIKKNVGALSVKNTNMEYQTVPLNNNAEVTIEINPGTVTENKLLDYKNAGIDRLSIGLQETNNELLNQIGRIHTYEEFLETYNLARKVGFKNINVDLMIGLPNQSIVNIKESLEKVIKLNPEHISVYSLILEEGTKLYKKYEEKQIELPDEELERYMYWYVKNTLENNGYIHYEISNFAKPGYESKHNISCWNQEEYIGFGIAAHSYINGIRYSNTTNIEEYIRNVGVLSVRDTKQVKNINDLYQIIHEVQTKENMQKEYMLLGLRKIEGVSVQKFKNKFGENPIFLFRNELNKLVEEDLIIVDGDNIKLTNKGLDLANLVWEEFV